jgi:ABC-2 type transport system ATP-binding protein
MLEHKDQADYWGRFSGTYDDALESMIGKEVRKNLARILSGEHDLGSVVEFGCGTGYFTRAIAENARHVTATDLSKRMIEAARSNLRGLDNVAFQVQDSESASMPSDEYDAALMANMLHTLDDPVKALKECYRVLKPGGTLLIINYTEEGMSRVERTLLFFRFALKFGFPPRKNWPLTSEKLRSFLAQAGFRIERIDLIKGRLNAFYIKAKKA